VKAHHKRHNSLLLQASNLMNRPFVGVGYICYYKYSLVRKCLPLLVLTFSHLYVLSFDCFLDRKNIREENNFSVL